MCFGWKELRERGRLSDRKFGNKIKSVYFIVNGAFIILNRNGGGGLYWFRVPTCTSEESFTQHETDGLNSATCSGAASLTSETVEIDSFS
jgi:hypothetical protein